MRVCWDLHHDIVFDQLVIIIGALNKVVGLKSNYIIVATITLSEQVLVHFILLHHIVTTLQLLYEKRVTHLLLHPIVDQLLFNLSWLLCYCIA
jgi:hypothetical protein